MTKPNILTDTTPVLDADRPGLVHSVITDAWGLYFAQGGVVMAAALRGMEAVLDRPDLRLASTSATFCRPVACGPVTTTVDVLRNGRRGAQVSGLLRDPGDDEAGANVVVSAVFTDPTLPGPTITPVPRPADLRTPPSHDATPLPIPGDYPLGFLDNTEWQTATDPDADITVADDDALPRLGLWFRFANPPAPPGTDWDPALLPIPGDALGSALVVALGDGEHPVGSVSLQIDVQVHAPISGTWIGIDSTCTRVGGGLAAGIAYVWSDTGDHVATVTQTAMLRGFPT